MAIFVTERHLEDMTLRTKCSCGFTIILSDEALADMTMNQIAEARRQHDQMVRDHMAWHATPNKALEQH